MENSGHIALSRQMAVSREIKVIANNLANLSTNAYKSETVAFVEYLRETDSGEQISFAQDIGLIRDLTEGKKFETSNSLDLAIAGDAYFEVETELGARYTRNGAFRLNSDGELVTQHGHPVMSDQETPIIIPGNSQSIKISRDGTISAGEGSLGRIKMVKFEQENALQKMAGGLYDAGDQAPEEAVGAELLQGMLEGSNVNGISEITRMMEAMRGYTSVSKMIKQEDERQRQAIRQLGGSQAV
ncbi:MAG: flagellar basal-body rod protein FlgF [Pseudomonadota bacterium]